MTHGEGCIAGLPFEVGQVGGVLFEEGVGSAFEFFDPLGLGEGATEPCEEMDVIGNAADDECGAIEASGGFGKKSVDSCPERHIEEKWAAFLGGEDEMQVGGGQGLRHRTRFGWMVLRNPVGVRGFLDVFTQGRSGDQPWALLRNPFGILLQACHGQ